MIKSDSTSQSLNSPRGFTLIEVLVVLGLVVVLASFSWPALQSTLQRSQLESAAKK
ncbi:MAG: prepilin-type N-terminal cleavage/methylation domain-containing protein [Planctomycetaceae bacterium]